MFIRLFLMFFLFLTSNACSKGPIKYVALGDSYTVGTGAKPTEAWPEVVTRRLQEKGVAIKLIDNLAQDGWTAKDVIKGQLPVVKKLKPDLISIMIGTNDRMRHVSKEDYRRSIQTILDELLKLVGSSNVIVVTSPDFLVSPVYANNQDAEGIGEFNTIIIEEARMRNFKVIDIFPVSQTMGSDPALFSNDGFHPSAKGYALWADIIEPAFLTK